MSTKQAPTMISRRWLATAGIAVWSVAAWITTPLPVAGADCNGAGDFGAGSGCAPPGGGASSSQGWPPTAVDWPPGGADTGSEGKGTGDHSGGADSSSAPIVMPNGQQVPVAKSHSMSSSGSSSGKDAPATPIVPAGPPSLTTSTPATSTPASSTPTTSTPTTTPIVVPNATH